MLRTLPIGVQIRMLRTGRCEESFMFFILWSQFCHSVIHLVKTVSLVSLRIWCGYKHLGKASKLNKMAAQFMHTTLVMQQALTCEWKVLESQNKCWGCLYVILLIKWSSEPPFFLFLPQAAPELTVTLWRFGLLPAETCHNQLTAHRIYCFML